MGRRENRDKVVLSCLNGTLSFVGPMNIRGNVLEGERWLLAAKKGGEVGGRFIVQDNEGDRVSKGCKELQDRLKSAHIGCSVSGLHGYVPDVPMMRDDENLLVAVVGRDGKAAGEVGGRRVHWSR